MTEDEEKALRDRITTLETELHMVHSRERHSRELLETFYSSPAGDAPRHDSLPSGRFGGISFIVNAYNMEPQLRRTLRSLSPDYQRASAEDIEVIIVDNGSSVPLGDDLRAEFPIIREIIRVDGHPSPVFGLNMALGRATREWVGLMIDGAHIITPGVLDNLKKVSTQFANPVINVPQYIFGDVSQNLAERLSVEEKFRREEEALRWIGWPENGYSLFSHAILPGETPVRYVLDAIESNCLVAKRSLFVEAGGFDERFDEPGGGLANIEIFERLIHRPDVTYVAFAGEGSFHQDHHGTTTSPRPEERQSLVRGYFERYRDVVNAEHIRILRSPFVFGVVRPMTRHIPTISVDYGLDRQKLLAQLAEFHVHKALFGGSVLQPRLTLKPDAANERQVWPMLAPCEAMLATKLLDYGELLRLCHARLKPRRYLEIGVDEGGSLSLAECPSIGIDPGFELVRSLRAPARLYRLPSDEFFAGPATELAAELAEVDLAFIDGMHLAEYVLRDFANVERRISPGAVVVLDDVLPGQPEMLQRDRKFNAWCGDVYKVIRLLRDVRPDLDIRVVSAFIGPYRKGLALISGLDPENTHLADNMDRLQADLESDRYAVSSIEELDSVMQPGGIADFESFMLDRSQRI